MKTKLFVTVLIVIALAVPFVGITSSASAATSCDPAYVLQTGNTFLVKPTGMDDTANLQCVFDEAVVFGADAKVLLASGVFHTAQIVVNNFHGQFMGKGMSNSVVMNLPNLYVTPVDMYFNPPSAGNPWPSLFSFIGGNYEVTDLAIHIVGDNGTTGWTIFGIDPPIIELALGIAVLGDQASARFERVLIEGEPADNSIFGYNLINGIFYEGFIGEYPDPISGSFQVYNSIIRRVASGTPVSNLKNAEVTISHNTFEDVFFGMDGGDFVYSSLEFSHNNVNAVLGFDLYNSFVAKDVGANFLIKNNVFHGELGPVFEQVFGEGNECLLVGNNVQNVTGTGIYLGPDIKGCTVAGGDNKTNVLDLGTDNILVGVNNMGTGVGPTIQHLLKP